MDGRFLSTFGLPSFGRSLPEVALNLRSLASGSCPIRAGTKNQHQIGTSAILCNSPPIYADSKHPCYEHLASIDRLLWPQQKLRSGKDWMSMKLHRCQQPALGDCMCAINVHSGSRHLWTSLQLQKRQSTARYATMSWILIVRLRSEKLCLTKATQSRQQGT